MKRLVGWLAVLVTLLGCAAGAPLPQPSDFPLHGDTPFGLTLHWRLDRDGTSVVAIGVVEGSSTQQFTEVVVELQGLDEQGRVVSRGVDYARPRSFSGTEPWPFSIQLRRTGGEARFVPRVANAVRRERPAGR